MIYMLCMCACACMCVPSIHELYRWPWCITFKFIVSAYYTAVLGFASRRMTKEDSLLARGWQISDRYACLVIQKYVYVIT